MRRELSQPGRARWQQSIVVDGVSWDVFEAQAGISLAALVQQSPLPHWESMRYWLYDLTLELAQAARDGTLPAHLGLGNVWITTSGHAVLLDEALPDQTSAREQFDVTEHSGRMQFLTRIARCTEPTSIPFRAATRAIRILR